MGARLVTCIFGLMSFDGNFKGKYVLKHLCQREIFCKKFSCMKLFHR
ncbi:hypothetical protein LEP1GSC058_3121 [Leptospira fainei serovar Hurstbridge str. BUT 6]|uniref:Uncharacterized protein n=1 Tax=Leptospira fainei serovar Hurstbridge str. BUT 6 TaxID=1193011 RepID=S3W0F6_9LEPT|nr:hypothetical protein LEP1GSC058_3121 [Leptospira fainei serovar Hurstbridge str. BUT 6]